VLSPDGTQLAFTARDEKSKIMLYVRSLASLAAQALPGTDDAIYPFWSPDSREVAFFAAGKLKKIHAKRRTAAGYMRELSAGARYLEQRWSDRFSLHLRTRSLFARACGRWNAGSGVETGRGYRREQPPVSILSS